MRSYKGTQNSDGIFPCSFSCNYGSESVPPNDGQRRFFDVLRYSGYQVVVKPLKVRKNETGEEYAIEKGVDVSLVSDLLCLAFEDAYDTAILVSGDADFVNPIEKVKLSLDEIVDKIKRN